MQRTQHLCAARQKTRSTRNNVLIRELRKRTPQTIHYYLHALRAAPRPNPPPGNRPRTPGEPSPSDCPPPRPKQPHPSTPTTQPAPNRSSPLELAPARNSAPAPATSSSTLQRYTASPVTPRPGTNPETTTSRQQPTPAAAAPIPSPSLQMPSPVFDAPDLANPSPTPHPKPTPRTFQIHGPHRHKMLCKSIARTSTQTTPRNFCKSVAWPSRRHVPNPSPVFLPQLCKSITHAVTKCFANSSLMQRHGIICGTRAHGERLRPLERDQESDRRRGRGRVGSIFAKARCGGSDWGTTSVTRRMARAPVLRVLPPHRPRAQKHALSSATH